MNSDVPPVRRPVEAVRFLARTAVWVISGVCAAEPVGIDDALNAIRAIGTEGHGNAEAGPAWARISRAPGVQLPVLLSAMNGASGPACNYLCAAISTIAEREVREGRLLPIESLGEVLLDSENDRRARRVAFELISRVDPVTASNLVPGFLEDPAPELRRIAVEHLLSHAADALGHDRTAAATVLYRQALGSARDPDQVTAIGESLKQLGHPVDLAALLGFITHWRTIGPFDNAGRAGFDRVFPPETNIDFSAEYDGKSGRVRWQKLVSTDPLGKVDFNKPYGMLKEVTGYAATEFYSDTTRPAEIRLGCKNGWKVWWNGQFLFGRDEYHRAAEIDQFRLPVVLVPGRNVALVKLTQNEQAEEWTVEWEFQLRVTDPTGRVLRSRNPAAPVARASEP